MRRWRPPEGGGSKTEIRPETQPPLRGAEPRRVVAQHVRPPQCVTADVGCTAVPAPALVPQKVWQDRGARAGNTVYILQKARQNKNAYASLSDRVGNY